MARPRRHIWYSVIVPGLWWVPSLRRWMVQHDIPPGTPYRSWRSARTMRTATRRALSAAQQHPTRRVVLDRWWLAKGRRRVQTWDIRPETT